MSEDTQEDTIYDFPELEARINDLCPVIIDLLNKHDIKGLQQIISSYIDHVTLQYSDHDDYDFTPAISPDTELPIIGLTIENYAKTLGWNGDDVMAALELG